MIVETDGGIGGGQDGERGKGGRGYSAAFYGGEGCTCEERREDDGSPLDPVAEVVFVVRVVGLEAAEECADPGDDCHLALEAAFANILFGGEELTALPRG